MNDEKYRLSHHDWNILDDLLSKHGFGGYYDLIECLKMILNDLGFGNTGIELDGEGTQSVNLPEIVKLLRDWVFEISHMDGFDEIIKKVIIKLEGEKINGKM